MTPFDTDRHVEAPWGPVSRAEKAIPEYQQGAVVRIGIAAPRMMVHPVDARRDDDARKATFDGWWQPQDGMVKNRGHQHQGFEDQNRYQRKAEQPDDPCPRRRREHHFAEMEAHGRGRIQKLVPMVHFMEAPKEGDFVVGAMPPVNQEVEQQEVQKQTAPAVPP